MMVMLERRPTEWAVRCASSHSSVLILSGQMHGAHLVVEDLGRRARQRLEPGLLQPGQVLGQGHARSAGPPRSPRAR